MIQKNYTLMDEAGMHMRPATQLANLCESFSCSAILRANGQEYDAKSAMSLLLAGIAHNAKVEICFDGPDESAALHALEAALLGSVLSPADETCAVSILAPGIALAPAMVLAEKRENTASRPALSAREERLRFLEARRRVTEDCLQAAAQLSGPQAEILLAHAKLAGEGMLSEAVLQCITANNCTAEAAVQQAIAALIAQFESAPNGILAQRAADLRDIQRRLTDALCNREGMRQIDADAIIVAREVLPCDLIGCDPSRIWGVVTGVGGTTSHAAIIARSLGIPMVLCAAETIDSIHSGQQIAIDTDAKQLLIDPDSRQEAHIRERMAALQRRQQEALQHAGQCPCTRDGRQICIDCNIESAAIAEFARKNGASGVGLFRSEYIFMNRDAAPSEEEQYAEYKKAAETFPGSVVIRTLDVGADKALPYLNFPEGENPLLGTRGIRYSLANPDLFRVQLRAILRASAHGRVKIMFPFVATLDEFRRGREMVERAKAELAQEGLPFDAAIPVGMMVELPCAALMADAFAREADFFSIGTNDLQQYTFAADRAARSAAQIIHPCHPAVLRLISMVASAAQKNGIEACICGGLAEVSSLLPLWIALGIDRLSVGSSALPQLKRQVESLNLEGSEAWLKEVLACATAEDVERLLAR